MHEDYRHVSLFAEDEARLHALERDLAGKYRQDIVLVAYVKGAEASDRRGARQRAHARDAHRLGGPVLPGHEEPGGGYPSLPGEEYRDPGDVGAFYPMDSENVRDIWNLEATRLERESGEG